ncbi:flagellar biosynthesis protein FliQ [Ruminococcaceae bacterium OttesenSCG-928-L11]|nr:flagellar biosynthesis protein FliQ [Ruminococcaceae bacterium OttesenSCG-928-L11]
MDDGVVMEIFGAALMTALKLAAPVLIVSVLVGLVIAIIQAATQVHEQTLTFVPKLIAIALILMLMGPWMIEEMKAFTVYIFEMIALYG